MTAEQRKKMLEDAEVAEALYRLATEGYNCVEKLEYRGDDGIVRIGTITRHIPPSTEAAIFWLCNRRPKQWKVGDEAMAQLFGKVKTQLDEYSKYKRH